MCDNCELVFENADVYLCRKCIDKVYPRQTETKIEYQEKIVEKQVIVDKDGTPIDTSFNPLAKSKFD